MIDVKFERLKKSKLILCDACMNDIKAEQPHFSLFLDAIGQGISLCEDCGNNLQNDMSEEYSKFVDLGL